MEMINSKPKVNESKLERLAKFGFKQVKELQEGSEILKETAMSKEQIELVKYYKQNYPFNKFITEDQVKQICHKYNLVCGDVDRFRGFVPESNLNDIENFKLKPVDSVITGMFKPYDSPLTFSVVLKNAEIRQSGRYFHIYKKDDDSKNPPYAFQKDISGRKDSFYGDDSKNIFDLANLGSGNLFLNNIGFQICAPVKDMDISGLELVEGYKLQRKIEIPDPVVLQPVKGGYLIVTAWGDEASDPLVVNENFN